MLAAGVCHQEGEGLAAFGAVVIHRRHMDGGGGLAFGQFQLAKAAALGYVGAQVGQVIAAHIQPPVQHTGLRS